MKITSLLLPLMLTALTTLHSAEPESRMFEMRTYYAMPGKLDDLHARFRHHTMALFAKHGMTNLGYWVPVENAENQLIYVLAYPSREARGKAWKEFSADPEWKQVVKESEANGKIVAKTASVFLAPTDFSPLIQPSVGTEARVFELRTYTATPGNLPALHERFRSHTTALFTRHGMVNITYWQPLGDQPKAADTLIYLLAHASVEAAQTSWNAFRADPEWIAVKKASEEKAGGSLTVENGVVSVFLQPTDYSPTR